MKIVYTATVVGILCILPTTGVAQELDLPMTLTIDDREVGKVLTGKDVRRALLRCNPPKSCRYVGLEREPQIFYAAEFERGGYSIEHRSGPPGPLWDARRRGRGNPIRFSTREMIAITSDYLDGEKTTFVRWKSKDLYSE